MIVDASGTILMVNGAANRMFGYEKGELDGKTINMLMPQPYSARHNSYLQKHAATGKAATSGKLRHLVALHKVLLVVACTALCVLLLQNAVAQADQ